MQERHSGSVTCGQAASAATVGATVWATSASFMKCWLMVTVLELDRTRAYDAREMSSDPWTSADPQPGEFDGDLAELDPRYVERREGDPDGKVMILVSVEGEDAERLQRLSERRGKTSADVVSDLLHDADRSVA